MSKADQVHAEGLADGYVSASNASVSITLTTQWIYTWNDIVKEV
jgi:hypothetical protein